MTSALRVEALGVTLDRRRVVDEIALDVAPGEWLSIIGPNGAGKSTLLRALVGAVASSGSVEIMGQDSAGLRPRALARLTAWVPQSPTIPAGMRVIDYVLLGRTPHRHPLAALRSEDVDVARAVLVELDMAELVDRRVDTLSGGERQRAIIARALVQEAPLLLLDEPTTALDLGHQQEVLDLLDSLRRDGGRTIITTMHDLTMAGHYADRLVLLAGGRIAAQGAPSEVLTAERLSRLYHADVRVQREQDGTVLVLPARRGPDSTGADQPAGAADAN